MFDQMKSLIFSLHAKIFYICFLLSTATFLVYKQSLSYGFFFDDYPTIINNIHTKLFNPWSTFCGFSRWISRFMNQMIVQSIGVSPFYFRLLGLIIHILSGILLFLLLLKTFQYLKKNSFIKKNYLFVSFAISAFFLLHPAQTQTVSYISQIQLEGLVVLFTVLTTLLFVLAAKSKNIVYKSIFYVLCFISLIFSAGTKEVIIVLPVLILLFDWFFIAEGSINMIKKRTFCHIILFVAMAISMNKFSVLTKRVVHDLPQTTIPNNRGNILTENFKQQITPYLFRISQFKVIVHYLRIFFLPSNISFDYDMKLSKSFLDLNVIVPFLFLFMFFFFLLFRFINNTVDPVVFSFLWFFITIIPRASIFIGQELICDYKTFLPSIGIMVFFGVFVTKFILFLYDYIKIIFKENKLIRNKIAFQSLIFILCFTTLGFSAYKQNFIWSSEIAFWQNSIKIAPKAARAYNNLGVAYLEAGEKVKAEKNYKKAIDCDNFYAEPHINIAILYQSVEKKDLAMVHYKRALEIGEAHPELFLNLGLLHTEENRINNAIYCFKEAIKLRPYYSKAHIFLGKIYQLKEKNPKEAIKHYEEAIKGDFQSQELYYLYAKALYQNKELDKSIDVLSNRVNINFADTSFLLGIDSYEKKKYAQASNLFGLFVRRNPQDIIARYNFSLSLLHSNRYDEALQEFFVCEKLDRKDDFPYIPLHITKCLICLGKNNEAEKEANRIINTTKFSNLREEAIVLMKQIKKEL